MKIRFIINGLGVVLLFLSLLFSCSKENSIKIEVLNVEAYKELFYPLPFGGAQDYGYVVTDSEGNRFHISNIEGFDEQYEEGFEYMIKVLLDIFLLTVRIVLMLWVMMNILWWK